MPHREIFHKRFFEILFKAGANPLLQARPGHQSGLAQKWSRPCGAGQSLYFQVDMQNNILCLDLVGFGTIWLDWAVSLIRLWETS